MVGSEFMSKTLIVLFTVPLLAAADISVDTKPIDRMIAQRTSAQNGGIDTQQLRIATENLAMSAKMNQQGQDAQFQKMMQNLDTLNAQAALNE